MNPIGMGILGFAHGHIGGYCGRWRECPELGVKLVAARTKVPFTMAWQMRVDAHNLQMKELLASGEFGRVFQVRRRWRNFCMAIGRRSGRRRKAGPC